MVEYLACLKRTKGNNDHTCRLIAKQYLQCRMDRQLMMRDEMANLGFRDDASAAPGSADGSNGGGSGSSESSGSSGSRGSSGSSGSEGGSEMR